MPSMQPHFQDEIALTTGTWNALKLINSTKADNLWDRQQLLREISEGTTFLPSETLFGRSADDSHDIQIWL